MIPARDDLASLKAKYKRSTSGELHLAGRDLLGDQVCAAAGKLLGGRPGVHFDVRAWMGLVRAGTASRPGIPPPIWPMQEIKEDIKTQILVLCLAVSRWTGRSIFCGRSTFPF